MDFNKEHMEKHGYGKYERLDVSLLPKLWLAYVADPEDSGKVHSTVKQRFLNGDQEVNNSVKQKRKEIPNIGLLDHKSNAKVCIIHRPGSACIRNT